MVKLSARSASTGATCFSLPVTLIKVPREIFSHASRSCPPCQPLCQLFNFVLAWGLTLPHGMPSPLWQRQRAVQHLPSVDDSQAQGLRQAAHVQLQDGRRHAKLQAGLPDWVVTVYQDAANSKGISSMKLHRDLGITQKSAWRLARCIRKAFAAGDLKLAGPVELGGAKARCGQAVAHQRGSRRLSTGFSNGCPGYSTET